MRSKTHTAAPANIDDYLARVTDDKRAALEQLRQTILEVIPMAEECISYQMPAFRHDGRVLVYFAAAANHCAFYPGGMVKRAVWPGLSRISSVTARPATVGSAMKRTGIPTLTSVFGTSNLAVAPAFTWPSRVDTPDSTMEIVIR